MRTTSTTPRSRTPRSFKPLSPASVWINVLHLKQMRPAMFPASVSIFIWEPSTHQIRTIRRYAGFVQLLMRHRLQNCISRWSRMWIVTCIQLGSTEFARGHFEHTDYQRGSRGRGWEGILNGYTDSSPKGDLDSRRTARIWDLWWAFSSIYVLFGSTLIGAHPMFRLTCIEDLVPKSRTWFHNSNGQDAVWVQNKLTSCIGAHSVRKMLTLGGYPGKRHSESGLGIKEKSCCIKKPMLTFKSFIRQFWEKPACPFETFSTIRSVISGKSSNLSAFFELPDDDGREFVPKWAPEWLRPRRPFAQEPSPCCSTLWDGLRASSTGGTLSVHPSICCPVW